MERENLGNSWLDTGYLPKDIFYDFVTLWNLKPLERAKVMVFGEKTIPRYNQSYLRDYTFSGVKSKALPLPEQFQIFLTYANSLGYGEFNQVLVNWYEGEHYIGSHADSESELVEGSPIVTISLGQERTFRIRNKEKKIVKDVITKDGLVLVMGTNFQKEFKHEIVKVTGKKVALLKNRISITCRQFK